MDSSTRNTGKERDKNTNAAVEARRVSLLRRFGAIIYDSIAIVALLFFATLPIVIMLKGQAIGAENPFYFLYLVLIAYFYFAISWTRGGQTLGMRAWKIRIFKNADETHAVNGADAMKRFSMAILSWLVLGLGFISAAFNKNKLAWHDRISNTHLRRYDESPETH